MISMKVVNKWNRRLLRAVTRKVTGSQSNGGGEESDDHSVGSNDDDVRITNNNGEITRTLQRRTREQIMESMPPLGNLSQSSPQHMDLLYALAYPKRVVVEKETKRANKSSGLVMASSPLEQGELDGEQDNDNFGGSKVAEEEKDDIVNDFPSEIHDDDADLLALGVNALRLDSETNDMDQFKGSSLTLPSGNEKEEEGEATSAV